MKKLLTSLSAFYLVTITLLILSYTKNSAIDDFPLDIEQIDAYVQSGNFGRDRKIRSIEVNNVWISKVPHEEKFESVFIGSSRSKYLRPNAFFNHKSLVVGGNSYAEISYGPLIEAEIIRNRFPDTKRYYFESSFLHRKCGLFAQPDHKKYLKWLEHLRVFWAPFHPEGAKVSSGKIKYLLKESIDGIQDFKLSNLIFSHDAGQDWDKFLTNELDFKQYGEYPISQTNETKSESILPQILTSNPKAQRISNAKECVPGDHLFEVIAEWGKFHSLEIIFFQPPVRSDLLEYKLNSGLESHNTHLRTLTKNKNLKFIDLNYLGNSLSKKWSYFSDEDHLNTCFGSLVFTQALLFSTREHPDFDTFLRPSNLASFCKVDSLGN